MEVADALVAVPEQAAERPRLPRRAWLAIAGVAVALAVVAVWGTVMEELGGADLHLGAVPFFGPLGWQATWSIAFPVVLAWLIVTGGLQWAARMPWRRLLVGVWAATVAWSVALGASAGWASLSNGLTSRFDYLPAVPAARTLGIGTFVSSYVDRLGDYPVHVQGHPPAMVALLWVLDATGLRGPGWEAAVLIAAGAAAPIAVLIAARSLAGEDAARRAAPFLVLAPWTLFVATTGDGLFTALAAWTIALVVLSTRREARHPVVLAVLAGALGALTLHFTYGLVPFLVLVPATVLVAARRLVLAVPAAAGAAAVTAAWNAAGFWWLDGFQATRHWHDVGASVDRPYWYFLLANLAVLGVMLGPAVVAALTLRLDRRLALLVVPTLVAVLVADLSGLSKGEVERIWLPVMPWLTLAVVSLVCLRPDRARAWLAVQAALTIGLQAMIGWPW